ncbi:hypothetical protein BDA99DRAFT_534391 [Phascolomyces articulosus]|uniref:Heterokaryon incompatibility domain-containing protein n=1 Tax=Phascolomyces articulosus TaxID=60185 RepID=A0AAD5K7D2_9FUNG|nr:hypothetical protein BDA99DRAFT_534391 [Phascolomyces articulosus]
MCIDQGSKEEKKQKIRNMHQIYKNAHCTIAPVPEPLHQVYDSTTHDSMGNTRILNTSVFAITRFLHQNCWNYHCCKRRGTTVVAFLNHMPELSQYTSKFEFPPSNNLPIYNRFINYYIKIEKSFCSDYLTSVLSRFWVCYVFKSEWRVVYGVNNIELICMAIIRERKKRNEDHWQLTTV